MDIADIGQNILKTILDFLKIPGEISVEAKNNQTKFNITLAEAGLLIGKDGENLRALQYLFPLMVMHQVGYHMAVGSLMVDVNNYHQEKENYLEALAKNTAERVIKTQRPEELDPMSSLERRIIHVVIEGINGVKSESLGEGENRRVVIKPAVGENF